MVALWLNSLPSYGKAYHSHTHTCPHPYSLCQRGRGCCCSGRPWVSHWCESLLPTHTHAMHNANTFIFACLHTVNGSSDWLLDHHDHLCTHTSMHTVGPWLPKEVGLWLVDQVLLCHWWRAPHTEGVCGGWLRQLDSTLFWKLERADILVVQAFCTLTHQLFRRNCKDVAKAHPSLVNQ